MAAYSFATNTFTGEDVKGFVSSSLLDNDTVTRELVTVHENVKKRMVIKITDDEVKLQTPSDAFVDQNTSAQGDEKYLDPVAFEFMKQESWKNLVASWLSRELKPGELQNYDGVTDLTDFHVNRWKKKIAIAHNRLYWLGKASVEEATFAAAYTGLLPKLIAGSDVFKTKLSSTQISFSGIAISSGIATVTHAAPAGTFRDGDVVTITATTTQQTAEITPDIFGVATNVSIIGRSYIINNCTATTFVLFRNVNKAQTKRTNATFATPNSAGGAMQFVNVSNVATVLSSIYAQMDYTSENSDANFNICIPLHIARAYQTKQGELGVNQLGALAVPKTIDYNGMKLQVMPFFPGNTILVAEKKNLHLGTDLLSDENSLETVNLRKTTLDQYVRTKAGMASDGNYVNGPEIQLVYPSA